jgi:hypothetical protein
MEFCDRAILVAVALLSCMFTPFFFSLLCRTGPEGWETARSLTACVSYSAELGTRTSEGHPGFLALRLQSKESRSRSLTI